MIAIRMKSTPKTRAFVAKASWECIGGRKIYFRSRWEVKVATYLETLQKGQKIASWEHEPKTFWFEEIKRGVRSYKPDFKVTQLDGSHYWIEVKGYMDSKSMTKIRRFRKYYPQEQLLVLDAEWFAKNANSLPK